MNTLQEIKPYEYQYIDILKHIQSNGTYCLNKRTNVNTIRIPHAILTVDLEKEFPILKCKKVGWKTAIKEILWIMQKQSNNINDLDAKIWDSWADESGSIGKAYGYQVAKPVIINNIEYTSQVDYVLSTLANDSSNRRCVIDLWNVDDLNDMNLTPCCYSSIWTVVDNKLNCMLIQRSADFLVGVPFNTTQYAVLTHLFARHLGIGVGQLTHVMADCHIYDYETHINGAKKMISNFEKINSLKNISSNFYKDIIESNNDAAHSLYIMKSEPKIKFSTEETDFFKISPSSILIDDYLSMKSINFEVAV